MMTRKWLMIVALLGAIALIGASLGLGLNFAGTRARAQTGADGPTLEWFGWSHFRLTSVEGKVILIHPWLTNPDSTMTLDQVNKADYILVSDGHGDELGETL